MWIGTAPAATVAVVDDRPDAWMFAPSPGPDPPYTGDPISIDKGTGVVTWKLLHPSERERLHADMCEPGG
jgi:hypothetical protein